MTGSTRGRGLEDLGAAIGAHRSLIGLVAALVGAIVGGAAVLFNVMIRAWTWVSTGYFEYSTRPGAAHGVLGIEPWAFLVLSPVVAALLYGPLVSRFAPTARGHGIPEVMLAVRRKGGRIPGRVAVVKLIASSLTIGSGGSAGREGPIVQVGASLGSSLATALRLPPSRVVLLASCGAAGGIAATFHAPLAGAVFALEVILTSFSAETFGYVVVSSVMASIVARALQGDETIVHVGRDLAFTHLADMWWVGLLGVLAGLAGLGFSKLLYAMEDGIDAVWGRLRLPDWSKPAVLGVLLGAGILVFPQMYGSGYPIEEAALAGTYSIGFLLLAMLGRAVYTSYTIGIGGSGGVFAPTLFIGAMAGAAFGQAIAPLTGTAPGVFGVIGMGAAFAGAARAPMTAVLIIVEMTGQYSLIMPMMLAVVLATGVSRFLTRATIYTEKLRRRGDVLDDPVDATLLGAKPVAEWMGPVPGSLRSDATLGSAILSMRGLHASDLPVVDESGRYLGLIGAIDLAIARQDEEDLGAPISSLVLRDASAPSTALPSVVLEALATSGASGLPILDGERRLVGWVSERDLIDRMHRDQRRAIAARAQSSFGSRWKERHRR